MRIGLWEPGEFGKNKNLENLVGSHQPKYCIYIWEPERAGSYKKWEPPNTGPYNYLINETSHTVRC
jgi:hypothetical protein